MENVFASHSDLLDSCFEELDYEYSDEEIDDLDDSFTSESGICTQSASPSSIHLDESENLPFKLRRELIKFDKVPSKLLDKRKWKTPKAGYIKLWRIRSSDGCFDMRRRCSTDSGGQNERVVKNICSLKAVIGSNLPSRTSDTKNRAYKESPESIDASISITFFNDLSCKKSPNVVTGRSIPWCAPK
nr:PREDICTED: uncharacterized protein LOC103314901 isoform X2 [Tribolium castaneum]|eukprot:XP_008200366.1 PREDICTED: uncharacterized protein LOC103314901 isoform X2 [Tribolium castaneum]